MKLSAKMLQMTICSFALFAGAMESKGACTTYTYLAVQGQDRSLKNGKVEGYTAAGGFPDGKGAIYIKFASGKLGSVDKTCFQIKFTDWDVYDKSIDLAHPKAKILLDAIAMSMTMGYEMFLELNIVGSTSSQEYRLLGGPIEIRNPK